MDARTGSRKNVRSSLIVTPRRADVPRLDGIGGAGGVGNVGMRAPRMLGVLVTLLVVVAVGAQSGARDGGGDQRILPKPYPAPTLPSASGSFKDPTFGSKIVRVTDASTAPDGAGVNSAAQDTMFNGDSSLFYLMYRSNGGTWIYAMDRTGAVRRLGQLPPWAVADGAAWDPKNPNRLFVMLMSRQSREVWQLDITRSPWRVTESKCFAFAEVPPGGYPYSRVQVSPDGRYFAVIASSFGVQDEYDHIVVWDRQTGAKHVVKTSTRPGVMSLMHGAVMDTSGEYLILDGVPWGKSWVYHWPTDRFSRVLTTAEGFGGHKAPGFKEIIHLRQGGRAMDRSVACQRGRGNRRYSGGRERRVRSTGTRTRTRPRSVHAGLCSPATSSGGFPPFYNYAVLHSAAIWRVQGFLSRQSQVLPPEFFEYDGHRLSKVDGIPNRRAGESERERDTLYFWLPDSISPKETPKNLKIADWRPMMEEIVRIYQDGSDRWMWRGLPTTGARTGTSERFRGPTSRPMGSGRCFRATGMARHVLTCFCFRSRRSGNRWMSNESGLADPSTRDGRGTRERDDANRHLGRVGPVGGERQSGHILSDAAMVHDVVSLLRVVVPTAGVGGRPRCATRRNRQTRSKQG